MYGLEMSISVKIPSSGGINVEWQKQAATRAICITTGEGLSQVLTSTLSRPHPELTFSRGMGSATQADSWEETADYVALVAEVWQLQSNCIMNRSDASINDSEIHICEQTAVQTHKGWRLGQTMHNFHLCHMRKKSIILTFWQETPLNVRELNDGT